MHSIAERVFSQSDRPLEQIEYAAIAITLVNESQFHIGLLHREDSAISLLHLAWHCDLRNDAPSTRYHWVNPRIHPRRLRQVATRCRQVWRANPLGIPYAFSPPNDAFNSETGTFLLGPTHYGLTCSSFVLAVFHLSGLSLVDQGTWPKDRPGDAEWKQFVFEALQTYEPRTSDAHIQAVQQELGSLRFRPEDIAAASIAAPHPAGFPEIAPVSAEIAKRLKSAAARG
jgi:hypothetical protein